VSSRPRVSAVAGAGNFRLATLWGSITLSWSLTCDVMAEPIEDEIRAIGERATAPLTPEQRHTPLAALATIVESLQRPEENRQLPG
jgi:hypothetical protein